MQELEKLAQNQEAQDRGEQPPMSKEQMGTGGQGTGSRSKAARKRWPRNTIPMARLQSSPKQMSGGRKIGAKAWKQTHGIGIGFDGGHGNAHARRNAYERPKRPIGSPFDQWRGYTNKPPMSAKSSLLKGKYVDHTITSQIGSQGDQTYVEVTGPTMPTGKTSVPYQSVLPKYEKTAETALNHSDIPPSERTKVRTYFDSLRTNGQ